MALKRNLAILSVSASVFFAFAYSSLAADQHTYVVKNVNSTSATSSNINGEGQYGHIDALLAQGDNGRISLYKVRSLAPDTNLLNIDLSPSSSYQTSDYWLDSSLFYLKATGDSNDEVRGNLWNYLP